MDEKKNILVVDDDREIVRAIALNLESEGFQVFKAYDGMEALDLAMTKDIHLIIIDVMMPKLDGLSAIMKIREKKNLPIIVLSAKSENSDKVIGLSMGADDCVTKPFNPMELVARVKAVLRRYQPTVAPATQPAGKYVEYPDLAINLTNYSVIYYGKQIDMPPKELELLYFLASSPNQVFTREQLLDHIWGYEYIGDTRTVDVHIKRLREKIKDHPAWSIATVWGIGYKFEVKNK